MDSHIAQFATVAGEYCEFIESIGLERTLGFFAVLQEHLCNLAFYANRLPIPYSPDNTEDFSSPPSENHAAISSSIHHVTYGISKQLVTEQASPDQLSESNYLMLFDDLADIYSDLKDGLLAWHEELPNREEEANYRWRWGYENHWGEHLFSALFTVHQIRFCLRED